MTHIMRTIKIYWQQCIQLQHMKKKTK